MRLVLTAEPWALRTFTRLQPTSRSSVTSRRRPWDGYPQLLTSFTWIRGAKTKTKVKVKDLPQGSLGDLTYEDAVPDEAPSYPTVIQQHLNNAKKFGDCVVLTRVGNFYELYADQAEQYGPLLGLKVARRKTSLGPVGMSGFQYYQLDKYLKQLVQDLNKSVAISEEQRNSAADQIKAGGLMYNRSVTRVITAGTLIDESFVDPLESNYLMSIQPVGSLGTTDESCGPAERSKVSAGNVGISWVDLSSGDFFIQETKVATLSSILARVSPREVLLPAASEGVSSDELKRLFGEGGYNVNYHDSSGMFDDTSSWVNLLDRSVAIKPDSFSETETRAASLLLDYVQSKLQGTKITLRPPIQRTDNDSMRIDKHSIRGLEIRSTIRDGFTEGSLLHTIRRTVTKSGTRALSQRLLSPSMSIPVIDSRLDLVEEFVEHELLTEVVRTHLERTSDIPRLIQKFSIGRGDADDLLSVGKTIDIMERLFEVLIAQTSDATALRRMSSVLNEINAIQFDKLGKLSRRIQSSIDEEGLSRQHVAENEEATVLSDFAEQVIENEGTGKRARKPSLKDSSKDIETSDDIWIMRKDASPTLRTIHEELEHTFISKADLTERLRAQLKTNSLILKWSAQSKYFCWVKGKDRNLSISGAHTIGSTKSTRSFVLPEWSALGTRIDQIRSRIRAEEARVFATLRDEVISNLVKLRRCSSILDDLDIACSTAVLSKELHLTRPVLHTGTTTHIIGGRHPMVDVGLSNAGRSFTLNDCLLTSAERIHLITGPNMAGKSTFLRQNALIAILAQTGIFVPATHASIGLVDQIFSRVGSADNLFNHQSTFMVEMVEVAAILNGATARSFVIMDEVGRGTTPEDGVAVGFACLKYLHDKVGCRVLFATHFHELADMTAGMRGVGGWCTDVQELEGGGWAYVHKLRRGVNRESHALKVARLAGLPEEAVEMAREVLHGKGKGREGVQSGGGAHDGGGVAS
ncbi:DNA mismatch repair protein Msh1 [Elsinoe ampelina]|uniref:DNA mismatch repair protein Msh1 n=1 Tax=Elsinoe ampelina TaxID=302913 RepID=A0A6A6G897_9PEZI|nr:DNA mismatch repair protein Msh1 [Elsinoe ampelina]